MASLGGVGAAPPAGGRSEVEKAYRDAWQKPGEAAALERLGAALPRFQGYAVAEGDLLLTEKELERYAMEKSLAGQLAAPLGGELIVNTESGVPTYWARGARQITYAVDRASFSPESRYATVVANMGKAAREWAKACSTCGLALAHASQHDAAPSHDQVTFIVRGVDAGGAFIAAAFFPNYAPSRRFLNVDPSYFSTTFDKVGVLRHELGHVLGYRHEHIRGVPGCYSETSNWLPLTPYDPRSVMHYFCGGAGSLTLKLTGTDKRGHRALYGAP
jgi:hypothetical protein